MGAIVFPLRGRPEGLGRTGCAGMRKERDVPAVAGREFPMGCWRLSFSSWVGKLGIGWVVSSWNWLVRSGRCLQSWVMEFSDGLGTGVSQDML